MRLRIDSFWGRKVSLNDLFAATSSGTFRDANGSTTASLNLSRTINLWRFAFAVFFACATGSSRRRWVMYTRWQPLAVEGGDLRLPGCRVLRITSFVFGKFDWEGVFQFTATVFFFFFLFPIPEFCRRNSHFKRGFARARHFGRHRSRLYATRKEDFIGTRGTFRYRGWVNCWICARLCDRQDSPVRPTCA